MRRTKQLRISSPDFSFLTESETAILMANQDYHDQYIDSFASQHQKRATTVLDSLTQDPALGFIVGIAVGIVGTWAFWWTIESLLNCWRMRRGRSVESLAERRYAVSQGADQV